MAPTTAEHLARLETGGLLARAPEAGEGAYLFRHALIQDAAYGSLLRTDRRRLHRIVAETLESLNPHAPADLAPLLAHHFQAAQDALRARHYFTLAADRALAGFANPEAARYYQAALALAPAPADQAPLLAGLGEAHFGQSHYREAIRTWQVAIACYQEAGDLDYQARLYARAARAAWNGGWSAEGLALGYAGLAAVEAGPETPGQAALLHELARACYLNGQNAAATPLAWRALAVAERLDLPDLQIDALSTLGMFVAEQPVTRLALLDRAVGLTEAGHRPVLGWRVHGAYGEVLKFLGRLDEAQEHHRRGVALAHQTGGGWREFFSLCNLIEVTLLRGEFAAAVAQIPAARAMIPPDPVAGRVYRSRLAEVETAWLRYQGELTTALLGLEFCLAEARDQGYPESVALLGCLRAAILLEQERPDEARRLLAEAVAISNRGLGDLVEPWCLLAAAEAGAGDLAAARQALASAHARQAGYPSPLGVEYLARAEARLARHAGDLAAAGSAFARAAAQATATERPWFHAHILLEWAEVEAAAGTAPARARAVAHLGAARDAFAALGVPLYAARATARLQPLD